MTNGITNTQLLEKLDDLVERLDDIEEKIIQRLDEIKPRQFEGYMIKIHKSFEKYERNSKTHEEMVKELNGAMIRCRALFTEYKDRKPIWYEFGKVPTPEEGEIWVKDINGNETLATCHGIAIMYPANSTIKAPEFWKPV